MSSSSSSSSASLKADPILVSYHDSIIRASNLKTLDDASWLDDNVITFAFEYVQYELLTSEANRLFQFVTPPVVQLLKMSDNSFVEPLLQSMDFLEKRFLFLPINNNTHVTAFAGSHWSLLVLSIRGILQHSIRYCILFVALEKLLYHFDSMSWANDHTAKTIQQKFQLFFHQNIPVINCDSPQQMNAYDCGLYVIVTAEEVSRKILEYDPDDNKSDKDLLKKCTADLRQNHHQRLCPTTTWRIPNTRSISEYGEEKRVFVIRLLNLIYLSKEKMALIRFLLSFPLIQSRHVCSWTREKRTVANRPRLTEVREGERTSFWLPHGHYFSFSFLSHRRWNRNRWNRTEEKNERERKWKRLTPSFFSSSSTSHAHILVCFSPAQINANSQMNSAYEKYDARTLSLGR